MCIRDSPCRILQVSRIGLALEGPVFRHITHEDTLEILDIILDNKQRDIGLLCTIARLENTEDSAIAGVQIATQSSVEARTNFFDNVYYPLYLRYLEEIAARTES